MPKRKTSSGPQQLDCSDGAKMLIDQMKEHPEEFKGYAGKFTSMLDKARAATQGGITTMSKRDGIAIMAAAETHLYEVWLAEDVLTNIMQPKPEVENAWGNATTPSQYIEQVHRMEQERYKLQMERERYEQEEFKRREYEHAMRSTKPFKGSI